MVGDLLGGCRLGAVVIACEAAAASWPAASSGERASSGPGPRTGLGVHLVLRTLGGRISGLVGCHRFFFLLRLRVSLPFGGFFVGVVPSSVVVAPGGVFFALLPTGFGGTAASTIRC